MAILISTQKQMLERRRNINDCYICGTALPPKSPGWRQQVVAEHVVPRSLLGAVPANQADAWPVELYVHKVCEVRHKHHRDQLVKILQALGNRSVTGWNKQDIGLLAREFRVAAKAGPKGQPVYSIGGTESAMLAPVLWTHGMHATLYGKVLPSELGFVTHPPVPIWIDKDGGIEEGLRNDEIRREHMLGLLRVAIYNGCVDEIRAWGNTLRYRCAWRQALLHRGGAWGCAWALEFPGVHEWAMRVCGVDAPWHGYYEVNELPTNCSVVGQTEVDEYNKYVKSFRSHNEPAWGFHVISEKQPFF